MASEEIQLAGFLKKYSPEIAALMESLHAKMQAMLPGAVRFVYDNYNALVIGFGPTERSSDAIFSIAAYPRWVNLYFLKGALISDPDNMLKGSGKVVRYFVVKRAADLDDPAIRTLMKRALKTSEAPFDVTASGKLIIKAISLKQRPRRPLGA